MASVTATSQCPNCMGALVFSPETGKLVCEFCESSFTPQEIEALNAAKMDKATDALKKEQAWEAKAQAASGEPAKPKAAPAHAEYKKSKWDASTIEEDWGEEGENLCTYSCASCGGEIICEEATGATQCPFCGNPTVVPGQFSIGLKPTWVIPFKMTQPQAEEALKKHYRGHIFLPNEFTDKNQIKKLQGTYVPFWLFNGECDADASFDCTKSTQRRDGDYVITTTNHYDVRRSGLIPFDKVPVDASTKMPDDMMDSIEPFDYKGLIPFTTSVFAGFVADKYDVTIDECIPRADDRCEATALQFLESDIKGYESVSVKHKKLRMEHGKVDYALLPVYTIKTAYEGKNYLFAMNGQTGKLVGDLPVSQKKFWTFCAGLTVILAAVLYATGIGSGLADILWEFLA